MTATRAYVAGLVAVAAIAAGSLAATAGTGGGERPRAAKAEARPAEPAWHRALRIRSEALNRRYALDDRPRMAPRD